MFNQLAIIGLGFIGRSIAAAIKKTDFCKTVIGYDPDPLLLSKTLKSKVIDTCKNDPAAIVKNADIVVIDSPISDYEAIFSEIKYELKDTTILTDVYNVKTNVIKIAQKKLGRYFQNFVPGHPLIGFEKLDTTKASSDLFATRPVILTPTSQTNSEAITLVKHFWQQMGGEVDIMTAEEHDKLLATTCHIPHILAFTFLNNLIDKRFQKLARHIDEGFYDFNRITTTSPKHWRDICLANRNEILEELRHFQTNLHNFQKLLETNNSEKLLQNLEHHKEKK